MSFQLEIVTPEESIFSGMVENVYLPGADGELGILAGHVPLVTSLSPGELRYHHDKGEKNIRGEAISSDHIRGYVNEKNRAGGYQGYKPFPYEVETGIFSTGLARRPD